jgi:hypothetical protein
MTGFSLVRRSGFRRRSMVTSFSRDVAGDVVARLADFFAALTVNVFFVFTLFVVFFFVAGTAGDLRIFG